MSIASITGASSILASQLQSATATPFNPATVGDDTAPGIVPRGGRFAAAIQDAFASVGLSIDGGTTSTTGTPASTVDSSTSSPTDASNASDAVSSFLHSLFAALHGQSATTPSATTDDASGGQPAVDPTAAGGTPPGGHHGHHHRVESDLNRLIAELDGTSDSATTGAAATVTAAAPAASTPTASSPTGSGDATLTTLEKSFDALLAQNGVPTTDSRATLSAFLDRLSAGLDGAPKTGNVVSTTA